MKINMNKTIWSLIASLLVFSGIMNAAEDKIGAEKDFQKEGVSVVTVDNKTDYPFRVKLQDQSSAASNGPSEVIRKKSRSEIREPREKDTVGYQGSNYIIEIDAETIGVKEVQDKFDWNRTQPIRYSFAVKNFEKGITTPKNVVLDVTYKLQKDKVLMTLEEGKK